MHFFKLLFKVCCLKIEHEIECIEHKHYVYLQNVLKWYHARSLATATVRFFLAILRQGYVIQHHKILEFYPRCHNLDENLIKITLIHFSLLFAPYFFFVRQRCHSNNERLVTNSSCITHPSSFCKPFSRSMDGWMDGWMDRKLYLPTLTLSTESDFHRGACKKRITEVEKKLQNSKNKNCYLQIAEK